MQTIGEETDVESLIVARETLDQRLEQMDAANPQDRATALRAIEILIERYVQPAINDPFLLAVPQDVPDLDGVAGFRIEGLVLSLFNRSMSELEKPSDEKLKATLKEYEMPIEDASRRESFYRVRAMQRANASIGGLINFLEKPLIGINPSKISSVRDEQLQIKQLLKQRIPGGIKYDLESLYERLNRGM